MRWEVVPVAEGMGGGEIILVFIVTAVLTVNCFDTQTHLCKARLKKNQENQEKISGTEQISYLKITLGRNWTILHTFYPF